MNSVNKAQLFAVISAGLYMVSYAITRNDALLISTSIFCGVGYLIMAFGKTDGGDGDA